MNSLNKENILLSVLLFIIVNSKVQADLYPLSIIHINDFHARFEATDHSGGTCNVGGKCIGGYARTVYTVRKLLEEQKNNNPVFINAGDNFQGTLWYNMGRWNVTSEMLNILPADIMTLGNHEFDHGIKGLVPFLEHINSTVLVANMDANNEPSMKGKYKKSHIIERGNRKIGFIGVTLQRVYKSAATGNLIFRNESNAIRHEAALLKAQGANIIIAVTHCGYDVDQIIAANVGSEIDVIVGSHSHTFLYTGTNYPGPERTCATCAYPTEIIHKNGHRTLIVQAASYARYVGNMTVYFDDDGNVVKYEGAPIYMSSSVAEDRQAVDAMKPWKQTIAEKGNAILGATKVDLLRNSCNSRECNLGNFYTDALIHSFLDYESNWSNVSIALVATSSMRVSIYNGNITYSHLITMSPYENLLHAIDLPGERLKEALEWSVQSIDLANNITISRSYLQVSGLKIIYNYLKPPGSRVVSLKVRCAECNVPKYEDFDPKKLYRIVGLSYIMDGGSGFSMFPQYGTNKRFGALNIDALVAYTSFKSPISTGIEGRITVMNK